MTHPAGGNSISLAALWIPVMPSTDGMSEKLKEAGRQGRTAFEQGFSGGVAPDKMGSDFGSRFMAGFQNKLRTGDFGTLGGAIDKLGAQVDEKLAAKMRTALPEAYRASTTAANELREAEERLARATELVNDATRTSTMTEFVAAKRAQSQATKDVEAATTRSTVAQQDYNEKMENFNVASRSAFSASSMLGGVVGGSLVAGFQLLSGAMEGVIHLGEHLFDEALHGAEEITEKLIDVGEQYDHLRIQTFEFSGATGEAAQTMNEHVAQLFSTLDVAGKDFGQTYAQLSTMLGMTPGSDLDQLAKTVEELSGRFSNLKAKDVATIFRDFKVPVADVNNQLGTLVKVSQDAGVSVGTLVSDLSGEAATVLQTFGLSLGQSAEFVADLEKHGLPAKSVVMALSASMREMGKTGADLKGVINDIVTAWQSGDKVEAEKLAGDYFKRPAAELIALAPELLGVLNSSADAYNSNADASAQYLDKTRDLNNEMEEFKHHVEGMLAPFGEAALGGLEHALDRVKTWFDENHEQIIDKIKQFGHTFIDAIPELKDFADTFLGMMQAMAPPLEGFVSMVLAGGAAVEALSGHFDTAGKMLDLSGKFGLSDPVGEAIDKIKPKMDALFDDAIRNSDKLKDSFDRAADSATNMFTPPPQGFSWWDDYSSPTFQYDNRPGFKPKGPGSSAPAAPGGGSPAPAMPPGQLPFASPFNQPGTPTPSGQLPSFAPQDQQSGYGVNAEQSMKARITQLGNQYGLSQVEIAEIMGVGKHESNWQGPGYMGFGPEAKSAGFNFDNDPIGAVDQFFKQFMDRRAKEGDPNDPQAVANYIWHTVHGAADPNYGQELLAASGFGGQKPLTAQGGLRVTGGTPGKDSVPILAQAGEFVWNRQAVDKFGPLIDLFNRIALQGFAGGGLVAAESWAAAQNNQPYTYGNLDCSGFVASVWGILTGRGPGHWFDTTAFASDSSAAQYGFVPGTMPGALNIAVNPEPGQRGHMMGQFPDGTFFESGGKDASAKFGGNTSNFGGFEKHFYLAGLPQAPGGGGFSAMSAGFGAGAGGFFGGMGGSLGMTGLGGASTGYGAGGLTPSEQLEQQKSIEEANERKGNIEREIQAKTQERDVAQAEVTRLQGLKESDPDKLKLPEQRKKVAELDEQLRQLGERKHHAEEDIQIAQDKAGERAMRGGRRGERRGDEYNIAEELGRGLLGGVADELGLTNVFGTKAPWEFGSAKLALGALNWGFGMLNAGGAGFQIPGSGGQFSLSGGSPLIPPTATGLGAPGSPHGWPIGPGNQNQPSPGPGNRGAGTVIHNADFSQTWNVNSSTDPEIARSVSNFASSQQYTSQIANAPGTFGSVGV